jgi:hypothetical protein
MSSCEILDIPGNVILQDPDDVVQKVPHIVQRSRGFDILDRFRSLAARDMRDLSSCSDMKSETQPVHSEK